MKEIENTNDSLFDLQNLSDLPKDFREELSINRRDDFEMQIIDLFKRAGGELSLDQVQVGFYRLYKERKERKQIMSKLYNMSRKSGAAAIESVKGRKGVYRLKDSFKE